MEHKVWLWHQSLLLLLLLASGFVTALLLLAGLPSIVDHPKSYADLGTVVLGSVGLLITAGIVLRLAIDYSPSGHKPNTLVFLTMRAVGVVVAVPGVILAVASVPMFFCRSTSTAHLTRGFWRFMLLASGTVLLVFVLRQCWRALSMHRHEREE